MNKQQSNTSNSQSSIESKRAKLAKLLAQKKAEQQLSQKSQLKTGNQPTLKRIPLVTREQYMPLSFAQQRLWFHDKLYQSSSDYNIMLPMSIEGQLSYEYTEAALNYVIARHEVLRTFYITKDQQPFQTIADEFEFKLHRFDFSELSYDAAMTQALALVQQEASHGFDLLKDLPIRVCFIELPAVDLDVGEASKILVINLHHIASDGWSIGVLLKEFGHFYNQLAANGKVDEFLPDLPLQYVDFTIWQRQQLQGDKLQKQLDYWGDKLKDLPAIHTLPLDFKRPAMKTTSGHTLSVKLDPKIERLLTPFAKAHQMTLFMLLNSAVALVIARYSNNHDVVIGTPVANRMHPDLQQLIGFFVNTIVLRINTNQPNLAAFLAHVRQVNIDAQSFQDVPFEQLVEYLKIERSNAHTPLFQIMFKMNTATATSMGQTEDDAEGSVIDGVRMRRVETELEYSKFDLDITAIADHHGIYFHWSYDSDLFKAGTIEQMSDDLIHLLSHLVNCEQLTELKPAQLPMLTPARELALLTQLNGASVDYDYVPSGQLFSRNHFDYANQIAISCALGDHSYAELEAESNRLARYLVAKGYGNRGVLGLCFNRNFALMVSVLAVLKAGAAYLSLDPSYPKARLQYTLDDSGLSLLLCQQAVVEGTVKGLVEGLVDDLNPNRQFEVLVLDDNDTQIQLGEQSAQPLELEIKPDLPAYMIYTSGSTGKPKGVVISHGALANFVAASGHRLKHEVNKDCRLLAISSLSFDMSVLDFVMAPTRGAQVVLASKEDVQDPMRLAQLIERYDINFMQATPTSWQMLLESNWQGKADLTALTGGEVTSAQLAQALQLGCLQLINAYGPTEATVWSMMTKVEPIGDIDQQLTIAEPLDNYCHVLLDEQLALVPKGCVGELYIGGPSLAIEYWQRPDLTEQAFIDNPFKSLPCDRLYKTGDWLRLLDDNRLQYVGRGDNQLKIRGFRIEVGEIEAAINRLPQVLQAVVNVQKQANKDPLLVGYVRPQAQWLAAHRQSHYFTQVQRWGELWNNSFAGTLGCQSDIQLRGCPYRLDQLTDAQRALEMTLAASETVNKIKQLKPKRLLEIGVGDGRLLTQYAEFCQQVVVTDLSAIAIEKIDQLISASGWQQVSGFHLAADDFTPFADSEFDVIVLNSVAQYFPDEDYFISVFELMLNHLAAGGHMLLGDIRSLDLLEAYLRSTQLFAGHDKLQQKTVSDEDELLFSPSYFVELGKKYPQISWVDIEVKIDALNHATNRYGYDVLVHKVDAIDTKPLMVEQWYCWQQKWQQQSPSPFGQLLAQHSTVFAITGLKNGRIAGDLAAVKTDDLAKAKALVSMQAWPRLAQLSDMAQQAGFVLKATWSQTCVDELDLIFIPKDWDGKVQIQAKGQYKAQWLVNNPQLKTFARRYVPELMQALNSQLPPHMMPDGIMLMNYLPLTDNSKVNRLALPRFVAKDFAEFVPATTQTEKQLQRIWAKLLQLEVESLSIHGSFFQLGGHSLLAVRLASQVQAQFSVDISIKQIFDSPTIAKMAAFIDELLQHQAAEVKAPDADADTDIVEAKVQPGDQLPCSYAQQRLWFIDNLNQDSSMYHLPLAFQLNGPFDYQLAEQVLRQIIVRHQVLRTTYHLVDEQVMQRVLPQFDFTIGVYQLAANDDKSLTEFIHQFRRARFDLAKDLMLRCAVVDLGEQSHLLLLNLHHIAADGWSLDILADEFIATYQQLHSGEQSSLDLLPVQYGDFTLWQRKWLTGEVLAQQLDYWSNQLAQLPQVHGLPLDRPRGAQKAYKGAAYLQTLDSELGQSLLTLANQRQMTPFMLLHAGLALVLGRNSHRDDVVIGTVVANRTRVEFESLIGFFVNTLVLRVSTHHDSVDDYLRHITEVNLDAQTHQDIPFEQLVEQAQVSRDMAYTPMIQVVLTVNSTVRNLSGKARTLPGIEIKPYFSDDLVAKFDIEIAAFVDDDGIALHWVYDKAIFDHDTIANFAQQLARVLQGLALQGLASQGMSSQPKLKPLDLPLFTTSQAQALMRDFNHTEQAVRTDLTVAARFLQHLQQQPTATAVICGEQHLSRAELDKRASHLALQLQQQGVGVNSKVAVLLPRTVDLPVALLAVMYAAAAFVPVDPQLPDERLNYILKHSQVSVVIANLFDSERITVDGLTVLAPDCTGVQAKAMSAVDGVSHHSNSPDDLAYMIYTSGSTGLPKGVLLEHLGLINLVEDGIARFGLTANSQMMQLAAIGFDASVWDWSLAFASGATVHLMDEQHRLDVAFLTQYIKNHVIDYAFVPPALLEVMAPCDFNQLKTITTGGEALSLSAALAWTGNEAGNEVKSKVSGRQLFNAYGPTENTVVACVAQIHGDETELTIGGPINNVTAYVLDHQGRVLPHGCVGELWLGGIGLARGYHQAEELNQQAFINSSVLEGERLYRTGDRVKRLKNGAIQFIGRVDSQIKVRGFRVEPGEIEAKLNAHPQVANAVVSLKTDDQGRDILCGYVVSSSAEPQALILELKQQLSSQLPYYMVPQRMDVLAQFPLTSNGKVDVAKLQLPTMAHLGELAPSSLASSENELILADIWLGLLRLKINRVQLDIDANFFELGGDSILSIQLVSRAASQGLHITVKQVFETPTIRGLAQLVDNNNQAQVIDAIQTPITGQMPLMPVQRRFFAKWHDFSHYNQSVMLQVPEDLTAQALTAIVSTLIRHHDALRLQFSGFDAQIKAEFKAIEQCHVNDWIVTLDWPVSTDELNVYQQSLNPRTDQLIKFLWFKPSAQQGDDHGRLLLIIHHLLVDGVSWRILLEDMQALYRQYASNQKLDLGRKTSGFNQWAQMLERQSESWQNQRAYWQQQLSQSDAIAASPLNAGLTKVSTKAPLNSVGRQSLQLSESQTELLLSHCHQAYRTNINELLLAALMMAVRACADISQLTLTLESHGRQQLDAHLDISRTVGWFTALYPLKLDISNAEDIGAIISQVKDSYRAVPCHGLAFGLLHQTSSLLANTPELAFNYLGQFDQLKSDDSRDFKPIQEAKGLEVNPLRPLDHGLVFNGMVANGQLGFSLSYDSSLYAESLAQGLCEQFDAALNKIIAHCQGLTGGLWSASDFPLAQLSRQDLIDWQLVEDQSISDIYPASGMQQGLLFHSMLDSGSYVTQVIIDFTDLDIAAFKQAWLKLVASQAIFRTAFVGAQAGNCHQLVRKTVELPWQQVDVSLLTEAQQNARFDKYLVEDKQQGFDETLAPLMRITIMDFGDHQTMIWSHHHALLDGWSLPLVFEQLAKHYQTAEQSLAPSSGVSSGVSSEASYKDYVAYLLSQDLNAAAAFWQNQLVDVEQVTPLPLAVLKKTTLKDAKGIATEQSSNHKHLIKLLRFDDKQTERLKTAAKAHKVTLNILLQAAWSLLLSRYSAQQRVTFGAVTSGRPAHLPQVEQLIGLFINTLPVVVAVDEKLSLADFVTQLQQAQIEREQYAYLPINQIQQQATIKHNLFDSLIVFENYPFDEAVASKAQEAALKVNSVYSNTGTSYGVTLTAQQSASQFSVKLDVSAQHYHQQSLDLLASQLQHVLLGFVSHLDDQVADVGLLPQFVKPQAKPQAKPDFPSDLVAMFERQVECHPLQIALKVADQTFSYRQLNQQVNQLAHYLAAQYSITCNDVIAIATSRSHWRVVAILAVNKLGACYLPLSSELPAGRIDLMLQAAKPVLVLADRSYQSLSPDNLLMLDNAEVVTAIGHCALDNPKAMQRSIDAPHHIIFTSGTSGRPKGVVGNYGACLNRVQWMLQQWPMTAGEHCVHITSMAFIRGVWELLVPLCGGGTLHLVERDLVRRTDDLYQLLVNENISRMVCAPSLLSALLEVQSSQTLRLNYWFVSGEPLKGVVAKRAIERLPETQLFNLYGSTEVMSDVSFAPINAQSCDDTFVSIGRAICGVELKVSDSQYQPLPVGAIGELVVYGRALANGYLDNKSGGFIGVDDERGYTKRGYATGDLAYVDLAGNLHCLGRIDDQVKIRGFRVELAEIEACLLEHDAIYAACVLLHNQQLVAFVVLNDGVKSDVFAQLEQTLANQLPDYMLPDAFVVREQMPLRPNGKVDKSCLRLDNDQQSLEAVLDDLTDNQALMAKVWAKVLKGDDGQSSQYALDANYFVVGGHSLQAIRLANEIKLAFGIQDYAFGVEQVFAHPTLAAMTAAVEQLLVKRQLDQNALALQSTPLNHMEEGEL